ncbi:unnamed protein product [Brassicogethes aeneus]|uniref:Cytochrome P450 n=1 Tax=Brassicogethes aeneus TaxID=1431903 RepID=A0A9P0BDW2_BRAAE|nr:unnamed protein product [Brassicogethes aeneus]
MFEVLVVVVVLVLIYYNVQCQKHKAKYKAFYDLPTPLYIPLIGNTWKMLGTNILNAINDFFKDFGNSTVAYIPHRTYFTSRYEELKILLQHPNVLEKSLEYNHLKAIFGNSLLLAPVPIWKKHRKLISRSFKQSILDSFTPIFYEKSCTLIKILKEKKYDENDIYHLFEKFTLDTFCEATLGIESTILTDVKEHEFVTGITLIQKKAFERIGNIIKMNDFLFSLCHDGKIFYKQMKILCNYIEKIMHKKKILIEEHNEALLNTNTLPVLDLLLQNEEKENLTDNYIKEEMILFAGAATDTTAYTLAYTCCLLAMHPEAQEKVYQEVMSLVGREGEITNMTLNDLKYTEMAINEAQRLLPVVPIIARQATADIELPDKVIPANSGIIMNFMDLHRNKDIYPDPMRYDPDRFLPEEVAKRPQFSFLPFSGGPRNCIGLKYATMVLKSSLANIVRNFKISTIYTSIHDLKLESSIVMTTAHPLDCHFTFRTI